MLTNARIGGVVSALLLCALSAQSSAAELEPRSDGMACAAPEYSLESLREEQQGDVGVKLLVGADGSVLDAKVVESSGYLTLDKASLRAGAKCKFKPISKGAEHPSGWVTMRYSWVIN
jgi:protein TonB